MSAAPHQDTTVNALVGLGDKLSTLPDGKFLAVLQTLARAAEAPPVQALIDEARPRLRVLRPERPPSLKRMLCAAFEDLFEVAPTVPGAITRAVIAPLWQMLETHAGQHLTSLQMAFHDASGENPKRQAEIAARIWALAAETLGAHSDSWPEAESFALLHDLLLAAGEIEAFKRLLPRRPMPSLGKPEFDILTRHLEALAASKIPPQGYLVAVAARLATPGQLIGWLRETGVAVPPALNQLAFDGAVGQIDRICAHRPEQTAEGFADEARQLLDSLDSLDGTLGSSWRKTLAEKAAAVAGILQERLKTDVLEATPQNILDVLVDGATTEQLRAAESHARALARARSLAGRLHLGAAAETMITTMRTQCIARINALLARSDAPDARHMPAGVAQSIRLVEIVEGSAVARRMLDDARARTPVHA
jgi:hypothetical protein